MENEKYGAVITAETSPFKKAINDLVSFMKNFGKEIKEDTRFEINPDISKKELLKWQEDLNNSLKEAKTNLNIFKGTSTEKYWQEDVDRYSEGLIAVNNRLKEIDDSEKEVNEDLKEINQNASQSTLGKLFDNSIKKIKHFTYYLLGARSVFSLFMKYQSIYYQYNEKMQYQSELSQNAIALSLAPAFEFLGNVVAYASIGIAKFIELLTGVNVLSKVTTKGIRDYNKSLKETQTLANGIDEVTNLNLPSGTGLASQYGALEDFQKKIAEVNKWFDENPWIKAIADGIKAVYNFIKDNWDIFKYVFGAVAIGTIGIKILTGISGIATAIGTLSSVGGIASAGAGLAGLAGLLSFIAGIGIITIALKTKAEFDDIKKAQPKVKDIRKNFDLITESIEKDLTILSGLPKNTEAYKKKVQEINQKWETINSNLQLGEDELLNNTDKAKKLSKTLSKFFNDDYYKKTIELSEKIGIERADEKARGFWGTWISKLTGADNLRKAYTNEMLNDYDKLKLKVNDLGEEIDDTFKDQNVNVKYKVNADTSKAESSMSKLFQKYGLATLNAGKTLAESIAKVLNPHANGLDYVPYDNYPALLHKGEAVVPAKYNPTIHSQGNDYTNSLLETMIIKLDDLSKRPVELDIDGQRFANATYPLYEQERNRNNYVEGVVR